MKNLDSRLQEILEFAISVVWLGAAFGIAFAGGWQAFTGGVDLKTPIFQSIIIVFFAFVLHELAHRILARRYGFHAVYHMWLPGLFISVVAALMGFIMAAPGGVHLEFQGNTADNLKKMGKTALVGPVTNMVLSLVFLGLAFRFVDYMNSLLAAGGVYPAALPSPDFLWGILAVGVEINAWLAVFNLLPFGDFDGFKVFIWNKIIWIAAFVAAIGVYILTTVGQSLL